MTEPTLDATGIYAKWNAPKAKASALPDDADAQAAVEQTEAAPDAKPQDFLTGDANEPFNSTAIYNKWNGSA